MSRIVSLPPRIVETNHLLWIVDVGSTELAIAAEVEVDTVTARDALGNKWWAGPFASAFPSLAEAATAFASIPIEELEAALLAEIHAADDDVEVFGARLPREAIARWGGPLILSFQLYFLLHLRSLIRLFGQQARRQRVPWIGLYDDSLARWATGFTVVGLPAVVIAVLLWQTSFVDGLGSGFISAGFVVTSCQLSWKTLIELRDWSTADV
jgi:hypothetical protein